MPLDKSILSGKEHRKPYKRAKAVDSMCRNHGLCSYCQNNRLYHNNKRMAAADNKITDIDYILYALKNSG